LTDAMWPAVACAVGGYGPGGQRCQRRSPSTHTRCGVPHLRRGARAHGYTGGPWPHAPWPPVVERAPPPAPCTPLPPCRALPPQRPPCRAKVDLSAPSAIEHSPLRGCRKWAAWAAWPCVRLSVVHKKPDRHPCLGSLQSSHGEPQATRSVDIRRAAMSVLIQGTRHAAARERPGAWEHGPVVRCGVRRSIATPNARGCGCVVLLAAVAAIHVGGLAVA
jgi:hypothetical protein